jgi:hypothetical protein
MIFTNYWRRWLFTMTLTAVVAVAVLTTNTRQSISTVPDNLEGVVSQLEKNIFLDRNGSRLNLSYENVWNVQD